MNILLIVILTLLTFLNIIAPYSGTAVITPILIGVTGDTQQAITLGLFYFAMGSAVRVVVFRSHIQWSYVRKLVPISVIGALIGAITSVEIPVTILLMIMVWVTSTYLIQKIRNTKKKKQNENRLGSYFVGLFTGFLQGTGVVGGSDMRNGFLFSRGLSIAEVGATTALVGLTNFCVALLYRGFKGTASIPELSQLLILLPFVIIATILGKKVLLKINKSIQDGIIFTVIGLSLIFLVYRLIVEAINLI